MKTRKMTSSQAALMAEALRARREVVLELMGLEIMNDAARSRVVEWRYEDYEYNLDDIDKVLEQLANRGDDGAPTAYGWQKK